MGGPTRGDAWFNELADFLGPAYLRNAFTKGTEQEVDFLVGALGLAQGRRVLDVGCGPGRHALALARRGIEVVGIDLSDRFVALAREAARAESLPATFEVLDVRDLAFDAEFDALICLCQGGFGLLRGEEDVGLLQRFRAAVRPGAPIALTAFSAYFAVRHLEEGEDFDAATGVLHERATLRDPDGAEAEYDLWTTVFTPRELALLASVAGLLVEGVYGVMPGAYATTPPSIEAAEHLLLARRPA